MTNIKLILAAILLGVGASAIESEGWVWWVAAGMVLGGLNLLRTLARDEL